LPDKKVRFDDFEIDYGRFQLARCGKTVRLEGLPLQLLMFLVENRGQLITANRFPASCGAKTCSSTWSRALTPRSGKSAVLSQTMPRSRNTCKPWSEEVIGSWLPMRKKTHRSRHRRPKGLLFRRKIWAGPSWLPLDSTQKIPSELQRFQSPPEIPVANFSRGGWMCSYRVIEKVVQG
jgi:hypothetical protein